MLMLLGCTGSVDDSSPSTTDSGTSGDPSTVFPSGDRVLFYNGHGGHPTDLSGAGEVEDIGRHYRDLLGYNTDHKDQLPDDLSPYRMIALMAPGFQKKPPTFNSTDISLLKGALDVGTRVVVYTEELMCSSNANNVNDLLAGLGVSMRMTADGANTYAVVETNNVDNAHQVGKDVGTLRMIDPCYFSVGGGQILATDDSNAHIIAAVERPENAGDVVLLGDLSMTDDSGHINDADNLTLLENLAMIEER